MKRPRNPGLPALACAIALTAAATLSGASAYADDDSRYYLAPSIGGITPDGKFGVDKNGGAGALRLGKPISPSA